MATYWHRIDDSGPDAIRSVSPRHLGRWGGALVVGVLLAMLVHGLAANPRFQWPVVWRTLWDSTVLQGLQTTLLLTALAMIIGSVGGLVLTVMRLSKNPVLSAVAWVYIWVFRGTPVLVQLFLWNFLGALWPTISIGIPFGPEFFSWPYNDLISLQTAAVLCLGLNEAAYMSEIVRSGIVSVDRGQAEAAASLGMSWRRTMRRIVFPQAMRVIIPPTGNEVIAMLKMTSLVSAISLVDITRAGQDIASRTFENVPALIAVSIWYLAVTSLLMVGQYYLERRYGRSDHAVSGPRERKERLSVRGGRAA
ncbi:amino acid ABC transporter permease [Streptomyces sp. NPDC051907]|uniref:amino acid ABC transporter permease n=1 Tax=Streptomyces sp. NPDC051907 TaxID=3155284 RepID=UPI0034314EF0